jgi:hypothetical protein
MLLLTSALTFAKVVASPRDVSEKLIREVP